MTYPRLVRYHSGMPERCRKLAGSEEQRMETITKLTFIAVGGAAGAVARYLVNVSPLNRLLTPFPFPTFVINVSGSFLIGLLLILLTDRFEVSDNFRMAVIVGFLGAFTTFSTFEIELYGLARDRYFTTAAIYLVLSVLMGFLGVIAGIAIGKRV
jgi:fluoride exporter